MLVRLVIQNVRPMGGAVAAVLVENGRVSGVDPDASGGSWTGGADVLDAGGALALPAFTDAHMHPDKSLWGEPWHSRPTARSLEDLIAHDVQVRQRLDTPVVERAGAVLREAVGRGTRAVRAHVDVAPQYGLDNVAGVAEAARRLQHAIDVQIVAFPQLGVARAPGTDALLRDALVNGADVIGGIDPWTLDGGPDYQLDLLFSLADEYRREIDLHLHDRGEAGVERIEQLAHRVIADGRAGRVTISHAFCIGDVEVGRQHEIAQLLADADIALTTCALGGEPILPYDVLTRMGVRVGLGSDGIRDPWTPFGNADMLERAHLAAYRSEGNSDAELRRPLELAIDGGNSLLGLDRVGFEFGDRADFVIMDGESLASVVVDRPARRWVIKGGNVVAANGQFVGSAD